MTSHKFRWWEVAAAAGSLSTLSALLGPNNSASRAEYDARPQPVFAPPSWLFGFAWIVLKALAVRADTTLLNTRDDPPSGPPRRILLAARGADWLFWATTMTMTTRLGSPRLGLVWALAQLASTGGVVAATRRRLPAVSATLSPQVVWLCYAVALGVGQVRVQDDAVFGRRT